jgi:CRP-like cAMP-binding protein
MRILHGISRKRQPLAASAVKPSGAGKLALLSETDIFRDLGPRDMEEIERMTAMTTCRRGKVFYTPGETGEVLFVLKQGRVNLFRINPDGKKLVLASVEPGTVFGEMSLIGQGMHDTFAEAAEECTLCVMSRSDVEHLLVNKPQVALRFLELLANRLSEVETRLETVAFKSVPARLAVEILRLAEGTQDRRVDGVSHQDLADAVGSYRETVTRILNDFKRDGLIELYRLSIAIRDAEGLKALAES